MTEKKKNVCLPKRLIASRKLIGNLAQNDFKKKFAGSYFGVIWAFIQPVITVLLYWFVFEFGLHQKVNDLRTGIEVPFVLWLMGGLVPWFYFQEALNGGTGVLDEYSYLVKKVVFNIRILPVVKVFSAVFVHAFFIIIVLLIYTFMGYPDRCTSGGKTYLCIVHTRFFCGIYAGCFCRYGILSGSLCASGGLLFVLHGDVYGRTDLCDKRCDGVFP